MATWTDNASAAMKCGKPYFSWWNDTKTVALILSAAVAVGAILLDRADRKKVYGDR